MATNEKTESREAESTPAVSTEEVNTGSSADEGKLQTENETQAGSSDKTGGVAGHEDQAEVDESISDVIGELENEGSAANAGVGAFQGSGMIKQTGAGGAFQKGNMDLLMDVNVTVRAELGKTVKSIEEIMGLNPGMIVELDRNAGDNVDLYLNDKIFASGEVTVVDGNFAIRIVNLAGKSDKSGRIS